MDFRLGVCSACHARFKIPAHFKPNRARCRECGGAVLVGPVGGAEPAPEPPARREPRRARESEAPARSETRAVEPPVRDVEPAPPEPPPVLPKARRAAVEPARDEALEPAIEPVKKKRVRRKRGLVLLIAALVIAVLTWWLWPGRDTHAGATHAAPPKTGQQGPSDSGGN
jgi:DNA-directed RNA polymerase subunit RPC12/RpoP